MRHPRRSVALRFAAAALMLAAAAVLVLVARDAWHWGRAMRAGDLRASVGPIAPGAWRVDTVLPQGLMRSVLGIDDDLAFRRASMSTLRDAKAKAGTVSENSLILLETALARIVQTDTNTARASRAADYLGVILYFDRSHPDRAISPYVNPKDPAAPTSGQTPEQKARAEFEIAVRLDPTNANAKRNLEKLLQQSKPQSQRGTAKPGSGERTGNKGSGSRPTGRGY